MKVKEILTSLVLFTLIVVIWYYNIKLVKNIPAHQSKSEIPSFNPTEIDSLPKFNFVYKDVKRDPFNVVFDTTRKEPVKPLFTLKGVVLSQNGSSALIEVFGQTYLMRKGETYLGMKIKEITPKDVVIEFRGKKEILRLWE